MMGLPLARQAQRLRASERTTFAYMPGLNDWAFLAAGNRYTSTKQYEWNTSDSVSRIVQR